MGENSRRKKLRFPFGLSMLAPLPSITNHNLKYLCNSKKNLNPEIKKRKKQAQHELSFETYLPWNTRMPINVNEVGKTTERIWVATVW